MLFSFMLGFICTVFVSQFFQGWIWIVVVGLLSSLFILTGILCIHGSSSVGELVVVLREVLWGLVFGVLAAMLLFKLLR